eukprot:CAMPEP_0172452900 /NCGR_PEP_ID=MMETSP1065-20121228/10417_1 /TAXON_ID=265537 /ORGANISM="Amphiprora paludosa, Strain CCMP125" /LENGTH=688 /DNA_ID=CAMNT_0013205031 /DNA_START=421 /DNA_END=2487 /DNA_ORIENTATION=+
MCMPTDTTVTAARPKLCHESDDALSKPLVAGVPPKERQHLFRYAKRFAVLTLITAYLGKQANPEQESVATMTLEGTAAGIMALQEWLRHVYALYPAWLPEIVSHTQSATLLYTFLVLVFLNKCWKALRYQMKQWQRTLTQQALQSVKSVSELGTAAGELLSKKHKDGSQMPGKGLKSTNEKARKQQQQQQKPEKRQLILSASESFLSLEIMEQMTLADMAHVFLYAQKVNQQGFSKTTFQQACRPAAVQAMQALDVATATSRGTLSSPHNPDQRIPVALLSTPSTADSDAMDALSFCAAARIFAEWRNVRAVPPGCPAYAFGMGLAKRDLIQNIRKMEQAAHDWMDFYQGVMLVNDNNSTPEPAGTSTTTTRIQSVTSPTIRQLLQHELETNCHARLPVLVEQSAASGLLWTKRQLQYQSSAMDNNARVPMEFPTPKAAFNAAYESVYGKFHGFLVRTVFQNTFEAAPPANEVLQHMNIPYQQDATAAANSTPSPDGDDEELSKLSNHQDKKPQTEEPEQDDDETWIQLPLEEWEDELSSSIDGNTSSSSSCDGSNPASSTGTPEAQHPLHHDDDEEDHRDHHDLDLGGRIVQIFTSVFGHCVTAGKREAHESRNALSSYHASQHQDLLLGAAATTLATSSATTTPENANSVLVERNDVPFYLSVIRSLEGGLEKLIAELNMDDPSRV